MRVRLRGRSSNYDLQSWGERPASGPGGRERIRCRSVDEARALVRRILPHHPQQPLRSLLVRVGGAPPRTESELREQLAQLIMRHLIEVFRVRPIALRVGVVPEAGVHEEPPAEFEGNEFEDDRRRAAVFFDLIIAPGPVFNAELSLEPPPAMSTEISASRSPIFSAELSLESPSTPSDPGA